MTEAKHNSRYCTCATNPSNLEIIKNPECPEHGERTEIPRPLAQSIVVDNNVMNHDSRPITDKHREAMKQARDKALDFYCLLHQLGFTDPNQQRFKNREFAIAATHIEEAVMWACKGICQ